MGTLTLQTPTALWDAIASRLYVHPDDRENPIVQALRDQGFEVVSNEYMLKGKAWFQNIAYCGVIDLEKEEAAIMKNTMLDWMREQPFPYEPRPSE